MMMVEQLLVIVVPNSALKRLESDIQWLHLLRSTEIVVIRKLKMQELSIDLVEENEKYKFVCNDQTIVAIDKESVKNLEVAQTICEALLQTLNFGIAVGKDLATNVN
jgi:3-dehydroquinate synthetase